MNGFTFPYNGKTVFVKTERERKTKNLARKILNQMLLPDCPSYIDGVMYHLQKATMEFKVISGEDWYSIKGNNFSEFGPVADLIQLHIL